MKLFFDSESTETICLGTSSENIYFWIAKEQDSEMGTTRIVTSHNDENIPTSALNFIATFDNPWYQKMQTISLTNNEYTQYVRTDVGPFPVGMECIIIPTQDAPNNLTATVVNDTTSESLSLEEQTDTETGKTAWMFVMPDAPVTITIGVSETQYTVSANFGQTLLETYPDGLPFEPSMPYTATEGTQLVFTLPWDGGWLDNREGNTESEYKIQIQYPESIQDSYEYVQSDWNVDDVDNPVEDDGSLSFTMPAENVTLNIDLIENDAYIAPPVETELTIVNNLPEGWSCEIAKLSEGDEEPVPIEDINSNITVQENDEVFIKVFNDNNEPVNYYPVEGEYSMDYDVVHENNEIMQQYNVYCSIEGDFNDEIPIGNIAYGISSHEIAENDNFGYGERFVIVPIPLTLTIQKP